MVKPMDKMTVVRTLFLVLALVNQGLVTFGQSALPINEENVEMFVSLLWTGVASVWAWWKNNDITKTSRTVK